MAVEKGRQRASHEQLIKAAKTSVVAPTCVVCEKEILKQIDGVGWDVRWPVGFSYKPPTVRCKYFFTSIWPSLKYKEDRLIEFLNIYSIKVPE